MAIGRGTALHSAEVEVRLVIDPPHLVRDQVAAGVVVERRTGIDVQDRREGTPVVGELLRVHRERPLLQGPVGPHRPAGLDRAVAAGDRDVAGQVQHRPEVPDPRARRDDELIAADSALIGLHRRDRSAAGAHAGDADPRHDPHALGLRLRGQAPQRADIVGVAALLLVQDRGNAGRLPVVEHVQHVAAAVTLALDEHRRVADRLLLGEDLCHVFVHLFRCDLQVTDGVVGESLGV